MRYLLNIIITVPNIEAINTLYLGTLDPLVLDFAQVLREQDPAWQSKPQYTLICPNAGAQHPSPGPPR